MNRAEKRREIKDINKTQQYMDSLTPIQKAIVQKTVNRVLNNSMEVILDEMYQIMRDNRISEERSKLIIAQFKRESKFTKKI